MDRLFYAQDTNNSNRVEIWLFDSNLNDWYEINTIEDGSYNIKYETFVTPIFTDKIRLGRKYSI